MAQVRAKFPQLMVLGQSKIYFDALEYQLKRSQYPAIFHEKNSDNEFEQEMEMAGLSVLQEKPENAPSAYNELIQGGSKRYIHLTYSLAIRTSKELMDDDKYGLIKKGPVLLARSAAFTQELIAWYTFNNGFTSNVTTVDGNPLFYSQHPLIGGTPATNLAPGSANVIYASGTWPNRPSTDIDFSVAGLQLATNHAARMVDNQGFPIPLRWQYVVTAPELRFLVREVLGSSGKPYTADNTINSLLPEDYKHMEVPWLNAAASWFMCAQKEDETLVAYHREKPKTTFDDDFDSDALKQKIRLRMSAGATRWQGLWGTQGP